MRSRSKTEWTSRGRRKKRDEHSHHRRKKAKIQNRTQAATTLVQTCRSMWKGNDSKQKAASIECSMLVIFLAHSVAFLLCFALLRLCVYNHISRRIRSNVIRSTRRYISNAMLHHLIIVLRGEWNHCETTERTNNRASAWMGGNWKRYVKWLANRT